MSVPHTRRGAWPERAWARFAGGIRIDTPGNARLALLGLPDQLGIKLNRGRAGAAEGPTAFRAALARFGTRFDLEARARLDGVVVWDAGDIVPVEGDGEAALHATHDRVSAAVVRLHELGLVPVCVGGGHDLTFPAVRALAKSLSHEAHAALGSHLSPGAPAALGGLNVDAHLDVRTEPGSGMPFRALLEGGWIDGARFEVLGAGRFVHDPEHVEWLESRGGRITPVAAVRRDPGAAVEAAFSRCFAEGRPGFVSIDLDAIDGAAAPGVSAVNPDGLDPATVASVVERAGREAAVRHLDIMELSPPHDVDGRTARIAALLFLCFVAGFRERAA